MRQGKESTAHDGSGLIRTPHVATAIERIQMIASPLHCSRANRTSIWSGYRRCSDLFGHGPVFRDLNFVLDIRAAVKIVGMNLPTTFIPYDAARGFEITHDDIDRFTAADSAISWIADRARPWLRYWQAGIGREGFYPFDLLAAAYVVAPRHFGCARVQAWVGKDSTLFIPFWRPTALLVAHSDGRVENAEAVGSASYCGKVSEDLKALVIDQLIL
jgi:purine nucleosidase